MLVTAGTAEAGGLLAADDADGELGHPAGQEIVAIAAVTEEIATEAIKLVEAEYERGQPQMNDNDLTKAEGRPRTRTEDGLAWACPFGIVPRG